MSADAQRERIANLELSPDSTAGWAIYTDTAGVQQYFTWDSILYDIYQIDTIGGSGDAGQVGFFTSSDGRNFNSNTYQAIDWTGIEVNDTFAVSGTQIELTAPGKYRLFSNINLEWETNDINTVEARIRKNGSTILPSGSNRYMRQNGNVPLGIVVESFDNSGTIGDYYEVVLRTTDAVNDSLYLVDTLTSFIISTVSGGSGPQGPAGTDGVDGQDGADGVSVDSAYVDTDSLFILLSNGDLDGGWYVKGDKGDPGEDGQDGNVLDSNDFYLDTIIPQNDSVYDFEIRNRYGDVLEKTLTLTVSQPPDADPQVLSTSAITGGGRTTLDQGGGSFDIVGGTNSSVSISGSEYSVSSINNFANSLSFNTGSGLLSLGRNGLSALSTSLDGRYLTSSDRYWTLSSSLLYPANTTDNVLIGTTSNVFSSKLRVAGQTSITVSASEALTLSDASGSNTKWEFSYTTSPLETYADIDAGINSWRYGINSSGDFFFSPTGASTGADLVIEDDGDIILDQYPSVRDDVSSLEPKNFFWSNANGDLLSSPVGVYPLQIIESGSITVDKYDYLIRAFANTTDVTITLPQDPPVGKTYIISYADALSNRVEVTATGTTTVDGSSTRVLNQASAGFKGLAIFTYDGAGNYVKFHQSTD